MAVFPPEAIKEWTDEIGGVGVTALCPDCGIDAAIGSASGYPVEDWFLRKIRGRYFGRGR